VQRYQSTYLRKPTIDECRVISARNEELGLPGCIGSFDCCHWQWAACPKGHAGAYQDRLGTCRIVIETTCDEHIYIHHLFSCAPGSVNDVNVLDILPLFSDVCAGVWPPARPFSINARPCTLPLNLVDGMYRKYPFFGAPYPIPLTAVERAFNCLQEALRKGVQRLYAVMTVRFLVALGPARDFYMANIVTTARAVAIMHYMIIVLRRNGYVSRPQSASYADQSDARPAAGGGPVSVAPAADVGDGGCAGGGTGDCDGGGVNGDGGGYVTGSGTDSALPTAGKIGSGCDGRRMPPICGSGDDLDGAGMGGAPLAAGMEGGGGSAGVSPPTTGGRGGGGGAGGAPPAISRGGGKAGAGGGPPAASEDGVDGVDVRPPVSTGSGGGTEGILVPMSSSTLRSVPALAAPFSGSFGHMLAAWGRGTDAVKHHSLRSDLAVRIWEAREELLAPYEYISLN